METSKDAKHQQSRSNQKKGGFQKDKRDKEQKKQRGDKSAALISRC